ncbi:hypothetical protein ACPESV_24570 [Streptomyces umbrinus]|uniref:hypothetical protein n=1 Tax=Streptomyces umbrinus TaxID=67370 RepID=UPI003C2EA961
MITKLIWIPDNGRPETLTADIPEGLLQQMRDLIGTAEWASSEAVMWINCRTNDGEPMIKRLFRLARITALDPEPTA